MNESKARFFDQQAHEPWADDEWTKGELAKIEWLFAQVKLAPGARVLEPGCGTGRLSRLLAERVGPSGLISACDISAAMIEKARKRCHRLPQVILHHAALEELALPPGSFDLVLCFNFFPHADDKLHTLTLLAAALKPGGRCAIFHLASSSFVNDLHRKAGTVIEHDLLPGQQELEKMFLLAGLEPLAFRDDDRFFALGVKPAEKA